MLEYRASEEIPSGFTNIKFVREDRNGTKFYEAVEDCINCGGKGEIPYYYYHCQGVCFACNGSGIHNVKYKVYTDEHADKIEQNRAKRAEQKRQKAIAEAEERNKEYICSLGFNSDGIGYLTLGKTFTIKDELKALGGKWRNRSYWILPTDTDLCETIRLDSKDMIADVCYNNLGQLIDLDWTPMYDAIEKWETAQNEKTKFVGNVGDKIELKVKYVGHGAWFETQFGSMAHFNFEDEEGNIYDWCTSGFPHIGKHSDSQNLCDEGEFYSMKATIKNHNEYNGRKQTVITRPKFSE